jgi:hypothetical protein
MGKRMSWSIERNYYEAVGPIGEHKNVEMIRVWRFDPPPWRLIFKTPDLALAEKIVQDHNDELNGILEP